MKKNTVKIIAAALALTAAAFASEVTAFAQEDYHTSNGIGYKKTATLQEDGSYVVDLQSFVTGKVTIVTEMKPVDIALVLDVSGSMVYGVSNTRTTTSIITHYCVKNERNADLENINVSDNHGYTYYYKDGDTFYQLNAESAQHEIGYNNHTKQTRYFVYYTKNGAKYYLGPDGFGTISKMANSYTSGYYEGTTYWTDEAKQYSSTNASTNLNANAQLTFYRSQSRIEVLKEATKKFIDTISYYDTHNLDGETIDRAHHQIAIVTFSNGATMLQGFTGVENVSAIETKVDEISVNGYTRTNLGVSKAMELFDGLPADRKTNSNKVMVLFTDGNPGGSDTFDTDIANGAIGAVTAFKNPDGAYKGVVYSIGMGLSGTQVTSFMNYVSSNYPYATSMTTPGAPAVIPAGDPGYSQMAGGADLSDIFDSIAESASGGSGADISSSSIVALDVVTNSFTIPTGADASNIKVLLAPLTGVESIGADKYSYTFGEEHEPTYFGDQFSEVAPDINYDDNSISVSGFPFSDYWCGPDDTAESGIHEGYKLILRFPIYLSEKALGGPFTATNDEQSGIYVDGQQVAKFNVPTVKVPVSIWIEKDGLEGDDSAVFTLYRAKADADPTILPADSDYKHFTKVVVNKNDMDADHIIKITGLDPDYYYKIKEDAWAWSYDVVGGKVRYTVKYNDDDVVQNPFIFTNEKNKDAVKHDEAVIRNIFTTKE